MFAALLPTIGGECQETAPCLRSGYIPSIRKSSDAVPRRDCVLDQCQDQRTISLPA